MIALRSRVKKVTASAVPIDDEGRPTGSAEDVDILAFEGLEARFDLVQTRRMVEDEEQIVFAPDDAVPEDDPRRLRPTDLPQRDDLPTGHPLRGKRLLSVVPSGWGDCALDAKGRLVPVDPKTGEPTKPVEPGPGGVTTGEVGDVGGRTP